MAGGAHARVNDEERPDAERCGLRLRTGLAIIPMNDGVQLRAGDEEILVLDTAKPQIVETILRGLARGEGQAAIRARVGAGYRELVDDVLEQLAQEGLLAEPSRGPDDDVTHYLSHFAGVSTQGVRRPVGPVCILGHHAAASLLAEAISAHGIEVTTDVPCALNVEARITVSFPCASRNISTRRWCCRSTRRPATKARRACLLTCHTAATRRWDRFTCPAKALLRLLPGALAADTAAFAEADAAWNAALNRCDAAVPHGTLPAFRYQVAGLAAAEVFAFLSRHRPLRTLNRAVTVDFEAMRTWTEPVWRIPWCPVCGAGT